MSATELLVPTFTQMLKALSAWLHKAQETQEHADADRLLLARLAPDMYPLGTQIRFACVQVHEAIHRLRGEAFPDALAALLDEGRQAAERPGTMADAQARLSEALALLEGLEGLGPGALDGKGAGDEDRPLAHALPNGMTLDLTARIYARDWALSQFYFHVMTAYAILRSQGVPLGKADYVAHMIGYFRADTLPRH